MSGCQKIQGVMTRSIESRVVVTGIGPVGPPGIGRDAFWGGILEGRTGLSRREYNLDGEPWASFPAHGVSEFQMEDPNIDQLALQSMMEWKEEELPVDLKYLIKAVSLALEDSSLDVTGDPAGASLVLAHENMGLMPFLSKVSEEAFNMHAGHGRALSKREFHEGLYRACMKSGYDVQSFMSLFHVARIFHVHNYSLFLNNACASGLYAIESASQMIRCGQSPVVVAAASDHSEIYKYLWFSGQGLYAEDGITRPFCRDGRGIVFGDGGAAIVLEDRTHAEDRGARIYAEYLGGGFHLEAWKVTTPQIGSDSYSLAMRKALEQGGIDGSEVDLICTHGVGAPAIDYYESKAINDVFGGRIRRLPAAAFKPYTGHNLGGSSLLETVIMLLALEHRTVPPLPNADKVNPGHNLSLIQEWTEAEMNIAMKTCCAFGGYNAAAVFRREG